MRPAASSLTPREAPSYKAAGRARGGLERGDTEAP